MLRYNLNCTFLFKLEFYLRLSETLYENLILIRHAKSNWDAPLQDLDRPLDQRE
jgi:hypothetical protein